MSGARNEPTMGAVLRLPRLLPVFLVLLATAVLAACGGGQGTQAALPVLKSLKPVAEATSKADSARFEMQFELAMPGLETPFAFSASGAFDTPRQKATMTLDLGSFAQLMGGLASAFGGDAPSGLSDASRWKLEMRLDGSVVFMRMPFLTSELPAGKEWVRLDLAAAARAGGFDLAQLQSMAAGSDPRETLSYLRAVAGKLTHLGTEDVRGVPTSHYFAVVDMQKALRTAARQAGQPGLLNQLQGLGQLVQNVPVDVWVDEQRLVRRMRMNFTVSAPGQTEQLTSTMTFELFDYGTDVVVQAPPADKLVDLSALRG